MVSYAQQRRYGLPVVGTVLMLVGWYVATEVVQILPTTFFPSPLVIYSAFKADQSFIIMNVWPTLIVALFAFVAAVILGVVTAAALTASETVRDAFFPLIVSGNSVPRISLAPLIIFYVGGFGAKYLIATWVAFFPVVANVMEGFMDLDESLEHLLASLDATTYQEFKYVRGPNAFPFIFDGMKVALPLSFIGAVVSEFIASKSGLGYLALLALNQLNIPLAFATVLIAGMLSMSGFFLIYLLQSRVIYWEEADFFAE